MTPKIVRGAVRVVSTAFALATLAAPLAAQQATTTGTVRGVVTGPDGKPLANATVVVTSSETGVRRGAQVDESGRYQIPFLDPGVYTVRAQFIGYRPVEKPGIRISIGQVEKVDFQLQTAPTQLAAQRITAEVEPLIETQKTGTSTRIGETQIRDLPVNGRNFKDLVVLAPGVSDVGNAGSGGGQSIGGGRTGASNILMDGANNNESFFGGDARGGDRAPFSYSIEAVKEIQVITAGYDVERGQFTGGTVNAVTKNGTNKFTGALFGYLRQDAVGSIKLTAHDYLDRPPTDFKAQQMGFSLGGPIIKDRAHFFMSLDRQVRQDPRPIFTASGLAGDAAVRATGINADTLQNIINIFRDVYGYDATSEVGNKTANTNENALFGRADFQLSNAHKLTVRDNYTKTDLTFDRVFISPTSTDFGSNGGHNTDHSNSLVASVQSVFGKWTNELRSQFAYELKPRPSDPAGGFGVAMPQITINNITSVLSDGSRQTTQIRAGSDPILHINNLQQRTTEVIDNLRIPFGPHNLKLGTNWLHVHAFNIFGNNALGGWTFNSTTDFENNNPSGFTRTLPYFGLSDLPAQDFNVNELSFYGQDEWQVSPKLFLTYGVRYDGSWYPEKPPQNFELQRRFPYLDIQSQPVDHNLAPRLGFTFDPGANGRQIFRGGSGIFYGRTPYVIYGNVLGATGQTTLSLNCSSTNGVPPMDLRAIAGDRSTIPTQCLAGAAAAGAPGVFVFDKDYQQPMSWKSNIAYDKLIAENWRGSVEYVYSTIRDNYVAQDDNFNPIVRFYADDFCPRQSNGALKDLNCSRVPIYVDPSTISTSNGSVNRVNSRRDPAFDRVGVYRSIGSTLSHQLIFQVQGRWSHGTLLSSYTYDRTWDNFSRGCCTTGTATSETRVAGQPWNYNNQWGPAEFQRPHSFVLSPTVDLKWGFKLSGIFRAYSGKPWTPRYQFDINGDGDANDRAYIPRESEIANYLFTGTAEDASLQRTILDRKVSQFKCLREHRGQIAGRNSCRNPSQKVLDASVRKRFTTLRGQNVELQADFFNVLNGINSHWGRRMTVTDDNTSLLIPSGFSTATNKFIYRANPTFGIASPETNFTTTQFQMQLGLRYNF